MLSNREAKISNHNLNDLYSYLLSQLIARETCIFPKVPLKDSGVSNKERVALFKCNPNTINFEISDLTKRDIKKFANYLKSIANVDATIQYNKKKRSHTFILPISTLASLCKSFYETFDKLHPNEIEKYQLESNKSRIVSEYKFQQCNVNLQLFLQDYYLDMPKGFEILFSKMLGMQKLFKSFMVNDNGNIQIKYLINDHEEAQRVLAYFKKYDLHASEKHEKLRDVTQYTFEIPMSKLCEDILADVKAHILQFSQDDLQRLRNTYNQDPYFPVTSFQRETLNFLKSVLQIERSLMIDILKTEVYTRTTKAVGILKNRLKDPSESIAELLKTTAADINHNLMFSHAALKEYIPENLLHYQKVLENVAKSSHVIEPYKPQKTLSNSTLSMFNFKACVNSVVSTVKRYNPMG